jgi:hypothetical protein
VLEDETVIDEGDTTKDAVAGWAEVGGIRAREKTIRTVKVAARLSLRKSLPKEPPPQRRHLRLLRSDRSFHPHKKVN